MSEKARVNMLTAVSEAAGMALATLDERERCLRIINRWMQFCITQRAPAETTAVLAKISTEIAEGEHNDLTT